MRLPGHLPQFRGPNIVGSDLCNHLNVLGKHDKFDRIIALNPPFRPQNGAVN